MPMVIGFGALPRRVSSGSARPSPLKRRVGIHIAVFEACSSFTRVTARQVARPPIVDFVARFQPGQFPGRTARQLSNLTINYSSGSFPHWYSTHLDSRRDVAPAILSPAVSCRARRDAPAHDVTLRGITTNSHGCENRLVRDVPERAGDAFRSRLYLLSLPAPFHRPAISQISSSARRRVPGVSAG